MCAYRYRERRRKLTTCPEIYSVNDCKLSHLRYALFCTRPIMTIIICHMSHHPGRYPNSLEKGEGGIKIDRPPKHIKKRGIEIDQPRNCQNGQKTAKAIYIEDDNATQGSLQDLGGKGYQWWKRYCLKLMNCFSQTELAEFLCTIIPRKSLRRDFVVSFNGVWRALQR